MIRSEDVGPAVFACVIAGMILASMLWGAIVQNCTTWNTKLIEADMAEYDSKTGQFKLIYPKKEGQIDAVHSE